MSGASILTSFYSNSAKNDRTYECRRQKEKQNEGYKEKTDREWKYFIALALI